MTSTSAAAAPAGPGRAARARLTLFSGLLPIAALACLGRLLLLLVTWPGNAALPEGGPSPGSPTGMTVIPSTVVAPATGVAAEASDLPALVPAGIAADPDPSAAIAPAAGPRAAGPPAAVAGEPPAGSKALLAVAAELRQRRERVERRERELETREVALKLVEERLAGQIDRLEGLRHDLDAILGKVSAEEEARLGQLVKVYEAMKAKKAASIFDATELDLLLPVIRRMRDAKVAAVIAEMDPAKARTLTAELARARQLPTLAPPTP